MKFAALIATLVLLVVSGIAACDQPGPSHQASGTSVVSSCAGCIDYRGAASVLQATVPVNTSSMGDSSAPVLAHHVFGGCSGHHTLHGQMKSNLYCYR